MIICFFAWNIAGELTFPFNCNLEDKNWFIEHIILYNRTYLNVN